MAKTSTKVNVHDYNLVALTEACDEEEVDAMMEDSVKIHYEHTPLPSPNPKKAKTKESKTKQTEGVTNEAIYDAIQSLIKRFDEQDKRLQSIEHRIEEDGKAIKENKEDIGKMKEEMADLRKENFTLKQQCLEHARYKRRWDLRLMGLPEKDKEDTREVVIGILTRVLPWSVEKLRVAVDTVHRLGKRNDAANNRLPRPVIIQFAMRTVRDEVWKKSREARVCKEMNLHFKEDFSREDREARAKLWPKVQEARRNGKRAFLKEGYALIDGQRVDP